MKKTWGTKSRKKKLDNLIERELFEFELGLDYDADFLNLFIPLLGVHIPDGVRELFNVLSTTIELVGDGMGGVSFRDTQEQTMSIFDRYGYDPVIVKPFIDDYERKLMLEYAEDRDVQKPSK